MRAVTALGHDARAIMPADMAIEIVKVTSEGSGTPHLAMVSWCESAMSKGILGQTMSAEAKPSGLGSGNAELHGEVREDIRNADARQIAGTVTRDLLYPLLALNRGSDGLRRSSRLVFDTGDAEDINNLANGIEKLTKAGLRSIPVKWVHEKLRIPEPEGDEATLDAAPADAKPALIPALQDKQAALAAYGFDGMENHPWVTRTMNSSAHTTPAPTFPDQQALDALPDPDAAVLDAVLSPIVEALSAGHSAEELIGLIGEWYPRMDDTALTEMLARAMFIAELHGRYSAQIEHGRA